MSLAMSKSGPVIHNEGKASGDHKPSFEFACDASELLSSENMEEGRDDELLESLDMQTFLIEDGSISSSAFLEENDPLQILCGSPTLSLLTVSHLEHGNKIPAPAFNRNAWKEDISLVQGNCNDFSSSIIRNLEKDHENVTKGKHSYNSCHADKAIHGMQKKIQKAALYSREGAQRRIIWGTQKLGYGGPHDCTKIPGVDVGLTGEARSCQKGASTRIDPSQSDARELERKSRKKLQHIVSDRLRRKALRDKLYALRALVPNITKMNKASILGDAINYVKALKRQAEEVEAEVSHLKEFSDQSLKRSAVIHQHQRDMPSTSTNAIVHEGELIRKQTEEVEISHQVVKFTMRRIRDRAYHLQVDCERSMNGEYWLHFTQALEALGYIDTIRANLSRVNDHISNNAIIEVQKDRIPSPG